MISDIISLADSLIKVYLQLSDPHKIKARRIQGVKDELISVMERHDELLIKTGEAVYSNNQKLLAKHNADLRECVNKIDLLEKELKIALADCGVGV